MMKKLLIAILLLACTALTSYAGDRLPREEPFSFSDVVLALLYANIDTFIHGIKK